MKYKGFILIREYPNSKKIGTFEPYTTGEYLKYPEIWKPVYETSIERDMKLKELGIE